MKANEKSPNINSIVVKKIIISFLLIVFSIIINNLFSNNSFAKTEYKIEDLLFNNSAFITVEGVQLHYRIWVPSSKNSSGNILLVHGLGGSTFSWRQVASKMADYGYQVLAVDLPGFGLSQRKPSVTHSQQERARLIWKLLDSLEIKGSWHLVGHSMGGGVVTAMALQRLSHINTLAVVNGSISTRGRRISSLLGQFKLLRNTTAKIMGELFLTRRRIKSFLKSAYGREPTPEEIEGYYYPLQIKNTHLTISSLLKRYRVDADLEERISELTIPILCLWGKEDKWVPPSKGYELVEKMLNGHLVIIDGAAHCPMETHPQVFILNLISFLKRFNYTFD